MQRTHRLLLATHLLNSDGLKIHATKDDWLHGMEIFCAVCWTGGCLIRAGFPLALLDHNCRHCTKARELRGTGTSSGAAPRRGCHKVVVTKHRSTSALHTMKKRTCRNVRQIPNQNHCALEIYPIFGLPRVSQHIAPRR